MEANEFPEKIYIQKKNSYNNIIGYDSEWTPIPLINEDNVEYTSTDAFLEKACKYLRTHLWQSVDDDNDSIVESVQNITLDNFIKDFKRYLENEL